MSGVLAAVFEWLISDLGAGAMSGLMFGLIFGLVLALVLLVLG